jgi:hypothetical protein
MTSAVAYSASVKRALVSPGVDLYWLPLGAGGSFVRFNGRVFEALEARIARRRPLDLYHSALEVHVTDGRFVIEITPVPDGDGRSRGVVAEGAVGTRQAARWRIFRYELRCWRSGAIPDVAEAVDSPTRVAGDEDDALRILDLLPSVPMEVWGRDELRAGEMWNSNSVIAWLLVRCGVRIEAVQPPARGRAPGWHAGVTVASRLTDKAGVRSR